MTGREGGGEEEGGRVGRIERIHEANRGMRIGAWRQGLNQARTTEPFHG
jgi:hypothetical protein